MSLNMYQCTYIKNFLATGLRCFVFLLPSALTPSSSYFFYLELLILWILELLGRDVNSMVCTNYNILLSYFVNSYTPLFCLCFLELTLAYNGNLLKLNVLYDAYFAWLYLGFEDLAMPYVLDIIICSFTLFILYFLGEFDNFTVYNASEF